MRTKNVRSELDLSTLGDPRSRSSSARSVSSNRRSAGIEREQHRTWSANAAISRFPSYSGRPHSAGSFRFSVRSISDRSAVPLWIGSSSPPSQATVRSFGQQTTNISNLNVDRCLVFPNPLPSLLEQRRIAEILDKADALRAKRRAALAQLDILTQSIFLDMFGDPATNPKGWPVVTIADICEVKGGKRLPKGEEYSSTPTPHRYIRGWT